MKTKQTKNSTIMPYKYRTEKPLMPTDFAAKLNRMGMKVLARQRDTNYIEYSLALMNHGGGGVKQLAEVYKLACAADINFSLHLHPQEQLVMSVAKDWFDLGPVIVMHDEEVHRPIGLHQLDTETISIYFTNVRLKREEGRTQNEIEKWRKLGLMLTDPPVVWKRVRWDPDCVQSIKRTNEGSTWFGEAGAYIGNLGAPYRFGETLPYGMACAGPFGAMRDYGHDYNDKLKSYIMAVSGRLVACKGRSGVFDVYDIRPVALYDIILFNRDAEILDARHLRGPDIWPE